ncbi:MAG: hypothetical protein RSJ41_01905 [Clostridia bacterium]
MSRILPSPPSMDGVIHRRKSALVESSLWVVMVEPSVVASVPTEMIVQASADWTDMSMRTVTSTRASNLAFFFI